MFPFSLPALLMAPLLEVAIATDGYIVAKRGTKSLVTSTDITVDVGVSIFLVYLAWPLIGCFIICISEDLQPGKHRSILPLLKPINVIDTGCSNLNMIQASAVLIVPLKVCHHHIRDWPPNIATISHDFNSASDFSAQSTGPWSHRACGWNDYSSYDIRCVL